MENSLTFDNLHIWVCNIFNMRWIICTVANKGLWWFNLNSKSTHLSAAAHLDSHIFKSKVGWMNNKKRKYFFVKLWKQLFKHQAWMDEVRALLWLLFNWPSSRKMSRPRKMSLLNCWPSLTKAYYPLTNSKPTFQRCIMCWASTLF